MIPPDWMLTSSTTKVVANTFGSTISAGAGELAVLDVTIDTSTENICLQKNGSEVNTLISGPDENAINHCPEYWQLTCIPIP